MFRQPKISVNFPLFLFLFPFLLAFLVGCTALPQVAPAEVGDTPTAAVGASSTETTTALIPLKVAIGPYLSYAPFYIAADMGYFKEEGLDVEFVRLPRPTDSLAVLVQGGLDAGSFVISSALLNAIVRDGGVKIVASKERLTDSECSYFGYMVRKGVDVSDPSKITPEFLKSLRYTAIPTSYSGYQLDTFLQQYGLSLDDINNAKAGDAASTFELMQQGAIDVASMAEPFVSRARSTGVGDLWLSLNKVSPDSQAVVVAFGPTILKDNPDAGKRFMVAYLKGVRTYAEGLTDETLAILAKELELDPTLVSQMCPPYIPTDGAINAQSIIDFGNWAAAKDMIDAPVTTEMFWDSSFVDYANQVLKDSK